MKFRFLPFFIIFFFLITSIFGFLFMSGMIHTECPLFQMLGGSCSPDTNALVLLSHHLAGLKSLSLSLITASFSALTLVLFSGILTIVFPVFSPGKFYFNFRSDKYIKFNLMENLISWLSLLNKGDYLLPLPA